MALKETRQTFETNIDLSVSGVAERGGILSFVPGVVGLGEYGNAAAVSGQLSKPAGLLLDDVEALNYYNHPEYRQRNVVPQGSVVGVATEGEFWTDFVETATADGASVGTYAPGDTLYLADSGKVSRQQIAGLRPTVGVALSALTSDGFLKIRLEI
jgi:hypothetical protein